MTTNFYFIDFERQALYAKLNQALSPQELALLRIEAGSDQIVEGTFIGKRSAAGLYCWDCGVTLCRMGIAGIHMGRGGEDEWFTACPKCGHSQTSEPLCGPGPVSVELGFSPPRSTRPTGVRGCSSFRWHVPHSETKSRLTELGLERESVVDEYGRPITGAAFLEMVENNCPVQFVDEDDGWS